MGCAKIRTYIQSGNAVFQNAGKREEIAGQIARAIAERHGFTPKVLLLTLSELQAAIATNPFPIDEGKGLQLFFLDSAPAAPDLTRLAALQSGREAFLLKGRVFYLYAPDGVGRSKLAAKVEQCLGVPATARNWNTVQQLLAMAGEGIG